MSRMISSSILITSRFKYLTLSHFLSAYMVTVLFTIYTNKVGTAKCDRQNASQ